MSGELHAAGEKLTFPVAVAKADKKPDKAQIEETDARLSGTIHRLDDLARETANQLNVLNTAKSEPRLEEGGQYLRAALDEFAPVMADVEAWVEGQLEPRINKLIGLVDQILVRNPYLKDSFDEALGPIRNVK